MQNLNDFWFFKKLVHLLENNVCNGCAIPLAFVAVSFLIVFDMMVNAVMCGCWMLT